MLILVDHLDLTYPQPAPGGSELAYWCVFDSELGGGSARLVPHGAEPAGLVGKKVDVQITQDNLSDIQAVPEDTTPVFQLEQRETPGDFKVVGLIKSVVWLDDAFENAVIELVVGPAVISFSAEEAGSLEFEYGEWVSFQIHGLTFWVGNQDPVDL